MSITIGQLGWIIIAFLAAGVILGWVQDWFDGQYEVTRRGWRVNVTRRWYGLRAHVVFRGTEDEDDPLRFVVLAWSTDNTPLPWLQVHKLNPEFLTYWDEDSEAFWAPVTDFAPYAVRRFHPYLWRFGRIRLPWLTKYLPLRQPAGYLQDGA